MTLVWDGEDHAASQLSVGLMNKFHPINQVS